MREFDRQKAWADSHIGEIDRVLRLVVPTIVHIRPTDLERDRSEGVDYEIRLPGGDVACRVRRANYPYRDLTITTTLPSGLTPELDKVKQGSIRWYLYAWATDDQFVDWMFVDVDQLLRSGLLEASLAKGRVKQTHSESRFVWVPSTELESAGAIVAADFASGRGLARAEPTAPAPDQKHSLQPDRKRVIRRS